MKNLNKKDEKHISVSEDIHDKLKLLSKKTGRTMRGMLVYMMAKEANNDKVD